jgi:hypothetical protein
MEGPAQTTALIGREPNGVGFFGYIEDGTTWPRPEEGAWPTVDEALAWARQRASRVQLTYGFSDESVFSAGTEPLPRLPAWPPPRYVRESIDSAVERAVNSSPADESSKLGVVEPERRHAPR